MARLRHRKWFQRTILLAMAALLWSQLALAGHGGCLDLAGTSMAAVADTRHGHDCESKVPSADKALCDTHCNEGGISADSGRIPPIPPLFDCPAHPCGAVLCVRAVRVTACAPALV